MKDERSIIKDQRSSLLTVTNSSFRLVAGSRCSTLAVSRLIVGGSNWNGEGLEVGMA